MDLMNKPEMITIDSLSNGKSVEALKNSFNAHRKYTLAKTRSGATQMDLYKSLALVVRDRLVEKWIETKKSQYDADVKRVNYLSMEYLVGRVLTQNMVNLDLQDKIECAVRELGYDLEELEETEIEAGLGNGGLGRLASCFLESMATLDLPANGYGMRYEFGIFHQHFRDGYQCEEADNWLRQGNPWEIPRPEHLHPIKFYGSVKHTAHPDGTETYDWVDTHDNVMAMAYDILIPGYQSQTVNSLRLWSARSTEEFDFQHFNDGDYIQAVSEKQINETISKVLYPNDKSVQGRELRLKQEYFFVSASLQDIIKRYKTNHSDYDQFPDKVAIQMNDTHPSLAVPELMRIFVDVEGMAWEEAWDITVRAMGYTNHTVLPEALEKWSVELLGYVLPRHLQIIFEINRRFLERVSKQFPKDPDRLNRMSIIEEGPVKFVRMHNLALVGSHAVNGVAALHTEILKKSLFKDFHEMFPDRIQNKTNGITQRIWLKECNPELSDLITERIGPNWVKDLSQMKQLLALSGDSDFHRRWREIKQINKTRLADFIRQTLDIQVDPESLFDVQIKRIHEYKRQLLNILHVIVLYSRIIKNPEENHLPRTVIFSGKSAPGYAMAKLIIKLINSVAKTINADEQIGDRLRVVFLPNYSVSLAEKIIPAANLSQQTSTAGMEASGTGNMKLALNGALTLGTLDGANIEILEEVGKDNIYIFGMTAEEVQSKVKNNYRPKEIYLANKELKLAIDMVQEGFFCPENPGVFHPIVDSLLNQGDRFMVLADFEDYCRAQKKIEEEFRNTDLWTIKSIVNSACMGKFSSDRTISEYAKDIWNVKPHRVERAE
ncbi:MAG: alpha-1,4 glucan phosphorylase [Nitrospinaceae bacterium]|nr:MAG: alpha-1,4 glucan phosphorylase [Nitrospinaceae bacterium]